MDAAWSPDGRSVTWESARLHKSEIQMDLVVALGLVIQQHRQLAQVDMPLLLVVFAGHCPQIDDLEVLGERELHLVKIRQLIARCIDRVVVRTPP